MNVRDFIDNMNGTFEFTSWASRVCYYDRVNVLENIANSLVNFGTGATTEYFSSPSKEERLRIVHQCAAEYETVLSDADADAVLDCCDRSVIVSFDCDAEMNALHEIALERFIAQCEADNCDDIDICGDCSLESFYGTARFR